MFTTAGEVALMTGARDGSATLTAAAAPEPGRKVDHMNAMKRALAGELLFTNWPLKRKGDIIKE
jgi:hypothetical protein